VQEIDLNKYPREVSKCPLHNARKLRMCIGSVTNKELYGKLPPLSDQINSRRFQLAGHYVIPFRAQHTATWIMG